MHDKIIERIKKLLELANSPNENEAKLAFTRAQDLITKYSINITDDVEEKVIEVIYIPSINSPTARPFIPKITWTIAAIFGCAVIAGDRHETRIIGFPTNIEITKFATDSILNQLNADCRAGIRESRSLAFAAAFWESAAQTVRTKFKQHKETGTGLILYDHAQEFLNQKYPNLGSYSPGLNSDSTAGKEFGAAAGNAVQIRQGIQSQQRGNLLK